jgi:glycosyltransferase involved in cell wall biosynthesis
MLPKLSILIPSLYKRNIFLTALLSQIQSQPDHLLSQTQILVDIDNGIKPIGSKRNALKESAEGEYIAYIDDDDRISDIYLTRIFEGIEKGVDHVGVCMEFRRDGESPEIVKSSIGHTWEKKGGVIYRTPQHICAIRKEIADMVSFPPVRFGEDKAFSELINPLLKTEHLCDDVIYYYNYRSDKKGI